MTFNQNVFSHSVSQVRLGDYITRSTANNRDLKYGANLIEGVTNEGAFSTPKGNLLDIDLQPYKIVQNGAFVYNPSRLDLGSIAYRTSGLCIVSHLYIVFYLNDLGKKKIDPEYLYMYFRRDQFYREVTFRNFGSQRPEFNFDNMSDIVIPLPDILVQKKFVNVYKSLIANQQSYERGLEDLKIVCDSYIENLRRSIPITKIGPYLTEINQRNDIGLNINAVRGLTTAKQIIPTKADMSGVSLTNYKVIQPGQIAYVPDTSRRGDKVSLGYNDTTESFFIVFYFHCI